jgi:hypothetical protein
MTFRTSVAEHLGTAGILNARQIMEKSPQILSRSGNTWNKTPLAVEEQTLSTQ